MLHFRMRGDWGQGERAEIGGSHLNRASARKMSSGHKESQTIPSFCEIAFLRPDVVVLGPLKEEVDLSPFAIMRAVRRPIADHV